MAFFDLTQPNWMWSYWGCTFDNGQDVTGGVTCGLAQYADVCGDGVTQVTQAGDDYNFAIGAIRDWELDAGVINHMLRYAVSQDIAKSPGTYYTDNIPFPDFNEDYYGPQDYSGNLVFGSTVSIPAAVDLTALGLSPAGMVLLRPASRPTER